jgi:hypothetical protein
MKRAIVVFPLVYLTLLCLYARKEIEASDNGTFIVIETFLGFCVAFLPIIIDLPKIRQRQLHIPLIFLATILAMIAYAFGWVVVYDMCSHHECFHAYTPLYWLLWMDFVIYSIVLLISTAVGIVALFQASLVGVHSQQATNIKND